MPPMSRTSFCSGRRSITGNGVSGSNSVELAPSMPATWRANSATAICMPRQMPRYGTLVLARAAGGADLALDAADAEAAGDQDAVALLELGARLVVGRALSESIQHDLDLAAVVGAAVAERLDHRQVGVLELGVLADERRS